MTRIVLTGGASGLGAAITGKLAALPDHALCITYCHSAGPAAALCARFPNVQAHRLDFSDPTAVNCCITMCRCGG